MGTIIERERDNGTVAYMARIRIKKKGRIVHAETKTFDRRPAASAWLGKREKELRKPGEIERAKAARPKLADAIDKLTAESAKEIGRTKAQVLAAIKGYEIAGMFCDEIESQHIVSLAQELASSRQPQTVGNYLSHLAAVFAVARPAWGYPLDRQAMQDATAVAKRLGLISKSRERDRRPTLDELDLLMEHFAAVHRKRPRSAPMHRIIAFAIFSTRRQGEIVRLARKDFEPKHGRVLVRDMKHPGEKIGNDQWCDLPPEAVRIAEAMPAGDLLFPFTEDAISAAFTRACALLGIEDLTFHDLRHDGISRLFEMGSTIPKAASVSGHRSWQSLKRYSHLRQTGDKYAGWKWLDLVAVTP